MSVLKKLNQFLVILYRMVSRSLSGHEDHNMLENFIAVNKNEFTALIQSKSLNENIAVHTVSSKCAAIPI